MHPLRAGPRKGTAFPPPLRNGAAKTLAPCATKASARPGGGEAPADGGAGAGRGLWPPAGEGRRCGVAKAMVFCHGSGEVGGTHGTTFYPLSGWRLEAHRVSPAPAKRCGKDRLTPRHAGQHPPVAGRALAGGFGPRKAKGQRGAVAKAITFANAAGAGETPRDPLFGLRTGPRNPLRSGSARNGSRLCDGSGWSCRPASGREAFSAPCLGRPGGEAAVRSLPSGAEDAPRCLRAVRAAGAGGAAIATGARAGPGASGRTAPRLRDQGRPRRSVADAPTPRPRTRQGNGGRFPAPATRPPQPRAAVRQSDQGTAPRRQPRARSRAFRCLLCP